jgi:hypothetical protein
MLCRALTKLSAKTAALNLASLSPCGTWPVSCGLWGVSCGRGASPPARRASPSRSWASHFSSFLSGGRKSFLQKNILRKTFCVKHFAKVQKSLFPNNKASSTERISFLRVIEATRCAVCECDSMSAKSLSTDLSSFPSAMELSGEALWSTGRGWHFGQRGHIPLGL